MCVCLLAIVIGHEADLRELVAEELWDQLSQILPVLAQHPLLQPAVVQRHVVVEHLGAGETVLESFVVLALDAVTLDFHRPTLVGRIFVLKEDPPLI